MSYARTQCTRCVLDRSAKEITFDENGVCNFCHQAQDSLREVKTKKSLDKYWSVRVEQRENNGTYDCLIGLSGGVDSSWTLHKAIQRGMRPLCFSVDTGWNKPEADENIMNLVETLEVPFIRYTIDLQRFKELQAAFMRSGVPNIEIPTDHVLMAVSYELAATYGIKTILSGGNVATESIMPPSWGYNARDLKHIKAIYKWATGKRLTGLPVCSLWKLNWYWWVKKIKVVYLLDYFDYNRAEAEKTLTERYGFKSTGEKHEENYFTWWHMNFWLFEKWGFDKRKAHYSSLINSGQMTREEALAKLGENPIYPELGFEKQAMSYTKQPHENFPMDTWYGRIAYIVNLWKS